MLQAKAVKLAENAHFQGFLQTHLLISLKLPRILSTSFHIWAAHAFKILLAMRVNPTSYSKSLHRLISLTYRPGKVARRLPGSARPAFQRSLTHTFHLLLISIKKIWIQLLAKSPSFSFPALLVLYYASSYSARWLIRRSRG